MPRRVDVSVPIGAQPAGVTARLWASDQDGNLDTSRPFVQLRLAGPRDDPRWLETPWLAGPWLARRRYAGWLGCAWLSQAWLEELALAELPGPEYEEGLLPFGVSVRDRFGAESTTPPTTGSVYVNDSPPRLRSAAVSVADDVVTMTVAAEAL